MKIKTRTGAPIPDDFDELIARVWKEPAFFLVHPLAIAVFGRECTRRALAQNWLHFRKCRMHWAPLRPLAK